MSENNEEAIETTVKMMRILEDVEDQRRCQETGHLPFSEMHLCPRCGEIDRVFMERVLSGGSPD